ncbi:hypothetical protein D9756_009881 [Leucocoprinus leucothites]|uniref:Transmembrane protein n=1 Tax=Leucocoprinus leucothites TaxID=201217 RepID=A0A8H5CSQ1_9AGAR|nr:hypothetical protein D9756_009881 [Leucoagaricus leucothites]
MDLGFITDGLLSTIGEKISELPEILKNNYVRCAGFFVFEGAFVALAAYLQKNTIPLRYPTPGFLSHFDTTKLLKSIIAFTLNSWQGWAVAFASSILKDAYSREWKVIDEANENKPEALKVPVDTVSTITADNTTRFKYWLFNRASASPTFKLAVIATLGTAWLTFAGPATIVVDDGKETRSILIGGLLFGTSQLSRDIMTMQNVNNLQLGYQTQENWIIPKPAYNASQVNGFEYISDLISFNHSCQWHAPNFANVSPVGGKVTIGGEDFDFRLFKQPPNSTTLDTATFGSAFYPVRPYLRATNAMNAFLIFGGNTSFPLNADPITGNASTPLSVLGTKATGNTIDLSGLPTVYNASWFDFSAGRFRSSDGSSFLAFRAPLATALVCNAQANLTSGTVSLASNQLSVKSSGDVPRVGNLNDSDIPKYFSLALDGLSSPDSNAYVRAPDPLGGSDPLLVDVTPLATFLLLSQVEAGSWVNTSNPPLSLEQIGKNMDALVLSASKAQRVDGNSYSSLDVPQSSGPMNLDVTGPVPTQVLTSSSVWFSLTGLFALVTFPLCLYIAHRISKENRPLYDEAHSASSPCSCKCSCTDCSCKRPPSPPTDPPASLKEPLGDETSIH